MGSALSAFEYLATCSEPAVESYELSRLNRAANLRKTVRQLIEEWIQCEVEAQLAHWRRDGRREHASTGEMPPAERDVALPEQLSLPLLSTKSPEDRSTAGKAPRISTVQEALAKIEHSMTLQHNNRATVRVRSKPDRPQCESARHATPSRRRQPALMPRHQRNAHDDVAHLLPSQPNGCFANSKDSPRLHVLCCNGHSSAQEEPVVHRFRRIDQAVPLSCMHQGPSTRVAARW